MRVYSVKQRLSQAAGFNQVAEFANRRLVRRWLATQIDFDEVAHRGTVIKRIFDPGVGQIEPDL
jgi:hypothetical protein